MRFIAIVCIELLAFHSCLVRGAPSRRHGMETTALAYNGDTPDDHEGVLEQTGVRSRSIPACSGTPSSSPPNFTLRILALGASIVWGMDSTDNNGFRNDLQNLILNAGGHVRYVGSKQNGNMLDNYVEATPGYRIDQVAAEAEYSLPYLPNLVVIHVGTNDCLLNFDLANAPNRLGALVDRILSAVPKTTVVVSTLIPNANTAAEKNIENFNAALPAMVSSRQKAGQRVFLVDMHNPSIFTRADLSPDGTHPTDEGYAKMAKIWYSGFQQIFQQCWLSPPDDSGISDTLVTTPVSKTCQETPGYAQGPIRTQSGGGTTDDGNYLHSAVAEGIQTVPSQSSTLTNQNHDPLGVRWADINGDGLDDYVYIGDNSIMGVALNMGHSGTESIWGQYIEYSQSMACPRSGVRFADIDGDGRDDFFCLTPKGDLSCWQNTVGSSPQEPTWIALGVIKSAEPGYPQNQIRLGDIDGDGRVDYLAIATSGSITGWRNNGQGVAPATWQPLGVVFSSNSSTDIDGVRFVDINGDGRDDWLWVSNSGQVVTWINQRGYDAGSLAPVWLIAGLTHTASGIPVTDRDQVVFGKIWGSGSSDYTYVHSTASTGHFPTIELYSNQGHGGTTQKGDGCRYCDMTGSGSDDYVWMDVDGSMMLFGNIHNPPAWQQFGAQKPPILLSSPYSRKDVRLADIDGDGKCDFILVNQTDNSFQVWFNNFSNGMLSWSAPSQYGGSASHAILVDRLCSQRNGIGLFDLAVRFADINGDGRADYLCIEPNGRVTGNLAAGGSSSTVKIPSSYTSVGQVKLAVGADRADVRFEDVNGDGRADYVWLDKFSGGFQYWSNEGATPVSGSSFSWYYRGAASNGAAARGGAVDFADLGGLGRADYVEVDPKTAVASVYYNVCPGSVSEPMPSLPPLPGCKTC